MKKELYYNMLIDDMEHERTFMIISNILYPNTVYIEGNRLYWLIDSDSVLTDIDDYIYITGVRLE